MGDLIMKASAYIFITVILLSACGKEPAGHTKEPVSTARQEVAWQMPDTAAYARYGKVKLSDYGFFEGRLSDLHPAERVMPYDINTPLFSDYALKKRFIFLSEGKYITYRPHEVLDFPEGAVLIKNFYYDDAQLGAGEGKIVETRLLIREKEGWKALPYLWNEEQTDAYLEITGRQVPMQLVNYGAISYSVPNMLQCKSCHDKNGQITPIGPSARQLNRVYPGENENQLQKFISSGWLKAAPAQDQWPKLVQWEDTSAALEGRARAYLEINCGHCHQKNGPAKNSGLDLNTNASEPLAMGIFKAPVAAGKGSGGHKFDIVPGNPEESILIYRMESTDPATMMPELGRSIVHKEGVQLIREWIAGMDR